MLRTRGQDFATLEQYGDPVRVHSGRRASTRRPGGNIIVSLDAKLQRRVQRYGWDSAAVCYERLWKRGLSRAQADLLSRLALRPGERVLDVACGTGLVSFAAASQVGPNGAVIGADLSGRMIEAAAARIEGSGMSHLRFERMDAEHLMMPDRHFDAALCAFGLMYVPDPGRAVREIGRVLKSNGRVGIAIWGERSNCGWSALFPIVDAEVSSDVCPLFFDLGTPGALVRLLAGANFHNIQEHRFASMLEHADADEACNAAFAGGPVALAWSRFDAATRPRVRNRYLVQISPWSDGAGYRIPVEFVIVTADAPLQFGADIADGAA